MLKQAKVDLITAVAPFGFDPELRAFARPLFTQKEAVGTTEMIMRVARQGFLQQHRAAMVDFLADYLHTLHYLTDPAHRDEAVKIIAEQTKQNPALYQSWAFTKQDYYRDPDALPNLDALQANVDLQRKLGFLRADLDVKKYVDLDIVKDAAKGLQGEATH